ncbi:unnamed protein product, partial [Heterotrigona itama]
MYICVKEVQQHEREIFNTYIAKCNVIYASYIIVAYMTTSIYVLGPTLFPMINVVSVTEYPFDTNRTSINIIVRVHQIVACYQRCSHVCMCMFGGFLIWFTAARFECLTAELKNNTNDRTLIVCIQKQLRLKRFQNIDENPGNSGPNDTLAFTARATCIFLQIRGRCDYLFSFHGTLCCSVMLIPHDNMRRRNGHELGPLQKRVRFNVVRTNAGNAEEHTVRDDVSETNNPFCQMCDIRTLSALLLH